LKKPNSYKEFINQIFNPEKKVDQVCSYNCFTKTYIKDIHLKLLNGEQKFGRTIILTEKGN